MKKQNYFQLLYVVAIGVIILLSSCAPVTTGHCAAYGDSWHTSQNKSKVKKTTIAPIPLNKSLKNKPY
jgi:hypothetical protein